MVSSIIGHTRQVAQFNHLLAKQKMAHAYFFYGPEGVGKFTLAKKLAQVLRCEQKPGSLDDTCGSCRECRTIELNTNPRVEILDLEHTLVSKKEKRSDIPIEDVRELRRRLSRAAPSDEWRIAIINQADKMNGEAANGFLKLLEEPGENILFILITKNLEGVLPTILSRAQPLGFYPVADQEMRDALKNKKIAADVLDKIIFCAQGRPGQALKFIENGKLLAEEEKLAKEVDLIFRQKDLSRLFILSEKASQDIELTTRVAELTFRILQSYLKKFASERKERETRALTETIKKADRVLSLLETTNVNRRFALDAMLLETIR